MTGGRDRGTDGRTDRLTDGKRMDGWTDGWTNRWTQVRTDGQINRGRSGCRKVGREDGGREARRGRWTN